MSCVHVERQRQLQRTTNNFNPTYVNVDDVVVEKGKKKGKGKKGKKKDKKDDLDRLKQEVEMVSTLKHICLNSN